MSLTVHMEAVLSLETSVSIYQNSRYHVSGDNTHHSYYWDNLKYNSTNLLHT
jgi:hypothetical protein